MAFGLYVASGLTALGWRLFFGIRINEFSLGNTLIVADKYVHLSAAC